MKKLSTYLFLVLFSFSAPSSAGNIQDFEIEGMTIGDSLLDYMSEEEIKENVGFVWPDKKFTIIIYNKASEIYDMVAIDYKSNDYFKIIQSHVSRPLHKNRIYSLMSKMDTNISSIISLCTFRELYISG